MASVDETDRAILTALRENSRQPYVDLAKTVGVSERTIRTRVRRLEEESIIRGYTIRETGIGLTALVRMKVGAGVESVYEISGEADLVAVVHVDDTVSLRELLDRMWLAAPAEIASTTTELVLEQY